jgi:hypothetical protein
MVPVQRRLTGRMAILATVRSPEVPGNRQCEMTEEAFT